MTDEPPALIRTTSYPDGRDEIVTAGADGLVETVASTPALRDLPRGTISSYRLEASVLKPEVLVSLLSVIGDDPEDAEDWPDDVAQDWVDGDEELEDNLGGLDLPARWVEVNEQRVTAVRTDDGALTPTLVDQDLMQLEVASPLAEHRWSSAGGGRPMDTDGGNSIGLLRAGVLYEYQWGDLGTEHAVRAVGTTPDEVGAAVADWISRAEIDQAAVLTLEPVDPHATLGGDDRAALRAALDDCGIAFSIYDDAVEHSTREYLARTNEHYRRTRDALVQPKSADGEALFALVRAVANGDDEVGALTFATWVG